jgi:signal transduction histidine kinase
MPIRWRLTFWYTGLLVLIILILGSSVYLLLEYSLIAEIDRNLDQKANEVLRSTRVVGNLPFFLRQVVLPDVEVFAGPDVYLQIVANNGEIATKSNNLGEYNLPVSNEAIENVNPRYSSFSSFNIENEKLRMVIKPLFLDEDVVGILQVARPLQTVNLALARLRSILFLGGLASLFVSLLLGWIMSGKALQPIRDLAGEAKTIGEDRDFQRRVSYHGPNDEIGGLAITFNNMLGRLDEAYQRLADALKVQQRFVADASHELRTPLTSIQGNVDFLLKKQTEEKSSALDGEVLADISSETRRVSRLVKDLLTLARADAGFSLDIVPLEFLPILEDTARNAQYLTKGHILEVDIQEVEGIEIKADADYLKQMLLIFFDNAFKYTPAGKKVIFQAKRTTQEILLIFQDEGLGIPEKDLPYLFDRFFRVQGSRSGEGTGLGLGIAKWIIDQHNGRIKVESELGHGTRFTIYLPILSLF